MKQAKEGTPPNLKQLAKSLDLSVTTVSRALKDGPEVKIDTRERVKNAAKKLGYYPNTKGMALRTGRTRVLTAILPLQTSYLSDLAKVPLIEGMTLAAQEQGYNLSVYSTVADEDQMVSLMRFIQSGSCDGVIVTRMARYDTRVSLLLDRNIPFVAFGRSEDSVAYPYVDVDNKKIAYEATNFLLDRGHTRIALQILRSDDATGRARLHGYATALQNRGISLDNSLIAEAAFGISESELILTQMFERKHSPTAIVCSSELGALGALSAIKKRKNRIVQDIDLITRDSTHLSNYLTPPISHHFVDLSEVGRMLVNALIRRIDGADPEVLQTVVSGTLVSHSDFS